ncbi:Cation/H(+) antiporter 15 [Striga hermonthica]|uniref:Cation/H(+) antiporter 15 n=1 Tax=Striga hermonthica TaxID=68872 RepID=A0A9N7R624_STRHE|nr:Cation/H(+) antiporter 15 [Striga hermonthica]
MGSLLMEPHDVASFAAIYEPSLDNTTICLNLLMVNSRGMFLGSDPFDYSFPRLLAQLSLSSLVILFTSYFLKPLGQPSMVIQILGGLVLGPSFLGRAAPFTALIFPLNGFIVLDALAIFGGMTYFFLIGVQIDAWVLKRIQKKDICIGISTVVFALLLSFTGAFSISKLPHVTPISDSLFIVALSSSVLGFPVIAHYLTELRMVNSEFGRMALSASIISNLFGFCVITAFILTQQNPYEVSARLESVLAGLVITAAVFLIVRPAVQWGLRRNPDGEPLKQGFVFMLFVGFLLSGFISKAVGLHIFFGPMMYGVALPAGPPLGSAMVEKLDLVTSWLFMPLYFVKNGLVTDAFSVGPGRYAVVQSVILLGCAGKFLGAVIASMYNGVGQREAVQVGLVMNVQGVMDLGLFKMMKQNQAVHEDAFVVLCVSMIAVTAIVTPIIRRLHDPLRRHVFHKTKTVMDLRPDSDLRLVACVHDQQHVPTTIDLIEALHPNKRSPVHICLVHLVEMAGRAHPILIPHKLNKASSRKAGASKSIVNAFKNFKERHDRVVSLHPFTAISSYSTMHDEVREMATNRRASLIITPYHQNLATPGVIRDSSESGIKLVNDNLLELAPCTVAVVVDRAPALTSQVDVKRERVMCRVAVFFIGGPDDREALAIGARMAGKPGVEVAVVRVLAESKIADEDDELKFDNDVLNDFRSQMAGNRRVAYFEEVVSDGTGTVGVIQSIEDHYDIIIVGRTHDTGSPLLMGILAWEEDSELGAIGGMFALSGSNSGSKILVVQQKCRLSSGKKAGDGPTLPL